jgi:hypothetical protein
MLGPFTGLSWRVPTLERIPTYLFHDQRVARSGTIDINWALQARPVLGNRCPCMTVTFDEAGDGDNVHTERLIRPCN